MRGPDQGAPGEHLTKTTPWRARARTEARGARARLRHSRGDVAQLGEHRVRIAGVRGSSPLISTIPHPDLPYLRTVARKRPRGPDFGAPGKRPAAGPRPVLGGRLPCPWASTVN